MPNLLSILDSATAHGIAHNSLRAMLVIRDEGRKRPTDIARRLRITRAGVSGIVNDLRKDGYIVKRRKPLQDERIVNICLTDSGRYTLERIEAGIIPIPAPQTPTP